LSFSKKMTEFSQTEYWIFTVWSLVLALHTTTLQAEANWGEKQQ